MIAKPLDSITLADLQALMENGVPEGKSLEYKREIPGQSPEDKKKILRAICALANTVGGDLVYGIEENAGVPVSIPGIDSTDEDSLRLRFESSCREGIQPRLSHLHLKFVPVNTGRSVLIVRVQKSWNAPHRLGQDGHFYGRNSAGTYPLDVGEIRQAFTLSEGVAERIRSFRVERLIRIESNDLPVPLEPGWKLAFHLIPVSAFASSGEARASLDARQVATLNPILGHGSTGFINLEGYVRHEQRRSGCPTYVQFYRNGIIESTAAFGQIDNEQMIPTIAIENSLARALSSYASLLKECEIAPPFTVHLALLGIRDHFLYSNHIPGFAKHQKISDRDKVILENISIDSETFDARVALRPLFDMWWNAFGYERCLDYGETGEWLG